MGEDWVTRPIESVVHPQRIKILHHSPITCSPKHGGPIIYWMSREQRVQDNWALIYAQQLMRERTEAHFPSYILVAFNMVPYYLGATQRQYAWLTRGLQEVEKSLVKLNIPMKLLMGDPIETIPALLNTFDPPATHLVCDFSPVEPASSWRLNVASNILNQKIPISMHMVDSHNIVPVWEASTKQEIAARTLRPKIHKLLSSFLTEFPVIDAQKLEDGNRTLLNDRIDWKLAWEMVSKQQPVPEVDWISPGEVAGLEALKDFCTRIHVYHEQRNDPNKHSQSRLSPYFHFGNLAPQRAALEVEKYRLTYPESVKDFLEELIIRRELSDNYCFYNRKYHSFEGLPAWARNSLILHQKDPRQYIYLLKQFEIYQTHDPLWNAAQITLVHMGTISGYMRMYWAKKILEWSESPQEAWNIAIYLNDKYQLDGRDPNGFVGCAWSIGGLHDQGWRERAVFGKVRYMNYEGCKRKFNVHKYISQCLELVDIEERKRQLLLLDQMG